MKGRGGEGAARKGGRGGGEHINLAILRFKNVFGMEGGAGGTETHAGRFPEAVKTATRPREKWREE